MNKKELRLYKIKKIGTENIQDTTKICLQFIKSCNLLTVRGNKKGLVNSSNFLYASLFLSSCSEFENIDLLAIIQNCFILRYIFHTSKSDVLQFNLK